MNKLKDLITNLSKIKEDNLLHVFLIPNKKSLTFVGLIISLLNLKDEDFLLVPRKQAERFGSEFINIDLY